MTAPEVPATNDPVAVARNTLSYAATALEASADNGDQYCASQIRAALAEVPADEGTLRQRVVSLALTACESGDAIWVAEAEELADAFVPFIESELQKARSGGWRRGWVAREPYVDAYYLDHQEPNPFEEES